MTFSLSSVAAPLRPRNEAHTAHHTPSRNPVACDIGAGSGRDANWLASNGWEVVAVEPSTLRDRAAGDSHQRVV